MDIISSCGKPADVKKTPENKALSASGAAIPEANVAGKVVNEGEK